MGIQGTWNYNYKCVKVPLRDLISPAKCEFTAKEEGDGKIKINVSFSCDEDIASAEVLENNKEIYAFDPREEYGPSKDFMTLSITFSEPKVITLNGKLKVLNSDFKFHEADKWHGSIWRKGKELIIQSPWLLDPGTFYIQIPRENIEKAILDFEFNNYKLKLNIKDIARNKAFASVYEKGLWLAVEDFTKQPDIPFHINKKDISFSAEIVPEKENSILSFRVITKSGKIYRSKPVVVDRASGKKEKLNVYSESKEKVITVDLDEKRIPDIEYKFSPETGVFLATGAGRDYYGEIGGGNGYGNFYNAPAKNYPKDAIDTAPDWKQESDGKYYLEFDGKGNYIFFPKETLPTGAFTLSFEVMPAENKKQYFIRSYKNNPQFFDLMLEKDETMKAVYRGGVRKGDKDLWIKERIMNTELKVPAGKWSKIEVIYDMNNFIFKVDGKTSKPFPFDRNAYRVKPFALGGNTPENETYFKGKLRSLKIKHNAAK